MILSKIKQTIAKYHMLSVGDTVAVCVSGGADSMCLLHAMLQLRDEWQLSLLVLNAEHGIRGEASVRDSAFVKQFCEDNVIPFQGVTLDVPAVAKETGRGIEETARDLRYAFFDSVNADKIATAHNASDNLETLLFRITRGTGMKGACGIPPVRDRVIRPLIDCTAAEIRQFCDAHPIPYVTDESNSDNRYARNYLRNEILPLLRRLNPSLENAGARFIRSISEAEQYLDRVAEATLQQCASDGALSRKELRQADSAVVKRVLIKWLEQNGIVTDECHIDGVAAFINRTGKYQIKGKTFVISDAEQLRLVVFEDAVDFCGVTLRQRIVSTAVFDELTQDAYDFCCDADKLFGEVTVRARREGDTIQPAGRGVTKTLKKLLNELKIPVERRESLPVFADEKGVIGIVGLCTDERVKIENTTKNILLLNILTEDKH